MDNGISTVTYIALFMILKKDLSNSWNKNKTHMDNIFGQQVENKLVTQESLCKDLATSIDYYFQLLLLKP